MKHTTKCCSKMSP